MSQYHHSYNYFHLLEGQNKYSNIYLLSGHQSVWRNTEPKDTDYGLNELADCIEFAIEIILGDYFKKTLKMGQFCTLTKMCLMCKLELLDKYLL